MEGYGHKCNFFLTKKATVTEYGYIQYMNVMMINLLQCLHHLTKETIAIVSLKILDTCCRSTAMEA